MNQRKSKKLLKKRFSTIYQYTKEKLGVEYFHAKVLAILFASDMDAYSKHGVSITGVAWKKGLIPYPCMPQTKSQWAEFNKIKRQYQS